MPNKRDELQELENVTIEKYNGKEVIENELKSAQKDAEKARMKIGEIGQEISEAAKQNRNLFSSYVRSKMKELTQWESELVYVEGKVHSYQIALIHYS